MGNVVFTGSVSLQTAPGQTVTITVTKPDATTETLTTTTQADRSFTVAKEYPAGDYTATAHVDADGTNSAADSPTVAFTVGLTPRTITLSVTVT